MNIMNINDKDFDTGDILLKAGDIDTKCTTIETDTNIINIIKDRIGEITHQIYGENLAAQIHTIADTVNDTDNTIDTVDGNVSEILGVVTGSGS